MGRSLEHLSALLTRGVTSGKSSHSSIRFLFGWHSQIGSTPGSLPLITFLKDGLPRLFSRPTLIIGAARGVKPHLDLPTLPPASASRWPERGRILCLKAQTDLLAPFSGPLLSMGIPTRQQRLPGMM